MAKKNMQVDLSTGEVSLPPNIRTHYNWTNSPGELFTLPSKTVRGQAYSVPELIKRLDSGQSMPSTWTPVYHGEDVYYPDVNLMELTDKMDYIAELKERTDALAAKYRREQSAEARLKLRKQIQDEINEQTKKTLEKLTKSNQKTEEKQP